jgi:AraC-like DNA-binding protein/anti-anti-sigma regulatory factor
VSGGQLVIRAERRGRICVVALLGPLDLAGSAGLAECVSAERSAGPARLVVDMSGVSSVDFSGALALAAAVSPVPGQCPVVVRSLRPAARRQLELAGLDLGGLDREAGSQPPGRDGTGRDGTLAGSVTGILVRERQYLLDSAERSIADSHRTAQNLARTEDHIAATLLGLAARRPAAAARLEGLSQAARSYATVLRGRQRDAADLAAPAPGRQLGTISGTAGRAIAFIEERARDDISVADIAAAAFVTVRAVQLAFRQHLDTTPLTYLRQVRLERAHDELLSADPDRTTVTAVAAGWHFTNASRFAAYYRAAYGVPPAHTLRQRRTGD